MKPDTHLFINPRLCGVPVELGPGHAAVELVCVAEMVADDRGLVHGGFVFGAADYAAMLAVNDPNVVLGAAETRFLAPVQVGDTVRVEASRSAEKGRKHTVTVAATVGGRAVFSGTFTCFVLDQHVLES